MCLDKEDVIQTDSGRHFKSACTTNINGVAMLSDIPIGSYTITEDTETIPSGYLKAADTEVRIDWQEESVVEIHNREQTGNNKISKTTDSMDEVKILNYIIS